MLEYEKFRSRTNVVFLLFVLARLAVWWTMPYNAFVDILETVWLGWLLYYYTTLAVRSLTHSLSCLDNTNKQYKKPVSLSCASCEKTF